MKHQLPIILIFLLTLGACDSPMNKRVRGTKEVERSDQNSLTFKETNLEVEIKWLKGPVGNLKINNHLLVFIFKDGLPHSVPSNLSLEFYSTMPSMGHAMEDAGYFEEIETGIYLNKNIKFNMNGDWKNELWVMDSEFNIKDRLEWLMLF